MEILKFIFSSGWIYAGTLIFILIITQLVLTTIGNILKRNIVKELNEVFKKYEKMKKELYQEEKNDKG